MIPITVQMLLDCDWKLASGIAYKTFILSDGTKYRIGWNPITYKMYVGYGELPKEMIYAEQLLSVIGVIIGIEEMEELEKIIFNEKENNLPHSLHAD